MQPSSDKLVKIKTSGFENLCGFYACANVIASESDFVRRRAYANIGLNNQSAEEFLFAQIISLKEGYDKVSKKMGELNSDEELALAEILKYKANVLSDLFGESEKIKVKEAMKDPLQKQQLLDEYCHFLFNERRDQVDPAKFPEASAIESPYSLEQFKELLAIYNKASQSGKGLLDVLDEAVPFKRIDSQSQTENIYQPNVVPIFLGGILQQKWNSEWKKEHVDDYKQKLRAEISDSLMRDIGIGADNNVSQYSVDFMMNKIIPGVANTIDLKDGHFTAYALESKIMKRLHEVAEVIPDESSPVARGGERIPPVLLPRPVAIPPAQTLRSIDTTSQLRHMQNDDLKKFCMDMLSDDNVLACVKLGTKDNSLNQEQIKFYSDNGDYFIAINGNELVINKNHINLKAGSGQESKEAVIETFLSNAQAIKFIAEASRPSVEPSPGGRVSHGSQAHR
jgi:hypothetical protein